VVTLRRALQRLTGAVAPLAPTYRRAAASGLAVFVFHDIDDEPSPYAEAMGIAVKVEQFERHLDWIGSRFNIVHPDAVAAGTVPGGSALLTFDDGFASVLSNALPALERRGAGAVLFLNMGVVAGEPQAAAAVHLASVANAGREVATPRTAEEAVRLLQEAGRLDELHQHQGSYLDTDQVNELDGHPLLRFGNHLWNHWYGPTLSDREFSEGVKRNAAALSVYAAALPWLAFTNGVGTPQLQQLAASQDRLFTGAGVINPDPGSRLLHRIDLADRVDGPLLFRSAVAARTALHRPALDR
jgi:peptidoglycan/xylan/chitin deacetylase (PgdA/CDA1 family)